MLTQFAPAWLRPLAFAAAFVWAAASALADDAPLIRSFDGPDTAWEMDHDGVGRIISQGYVAGGARDNGGAERVVITAPGGESAKLVCPAAPAAVIDELEVRIWLKANRPDIQLGAKIALPRTANENGSPATTALVRGPKYERAGHWQQLVLTNIPKLLAAEIRIMRSAPGARIDAREALLDSVVLIMPGDPNGVEVITDDLVINGIVTKKAPDEIQLASYPSTPAPATTAPPRAAPATLRRLPQGPAQVSAAEDQQRVRLQGDLLLVADRPFLPRAVRYRDEPFEQLAGRGFNTVWLNEPPTPEQMAQAKRHELWFITTPPRPETLAIRGVGQPSDRVVAWFLSDPAMQADPQYAQRWAELVRERDAVAGRPILIAPFDSHAAASESADVLLAMGPRGSRKSPAEYGDWLQRQSRQARPGTPVWAWLPTQFGALAARQVNALSGRPLTPVNCDTDKLDDLVNAAIMNGTRGFVFDSESSLVETDNATRLRAAHLELINRRLQTLEPWLASGKLIGQVPSSDPAVSAIVLQVNQAQLLIPISNAAPANSASQDVTFIVPGIPESCQVFAFSPVALKALALQRVAGGTRFTLKPEPDTLILLTEDPKAVQSVRQTMARFGERIVRLQREAAALQAATIADVTGRLAQNGINTTAVAQSMASVNPLLQQADAALASRQIEQAYRTSASAADVLEESAEDLRRMSVGASSRTSNPLALSIDRLPQYVAFERSRSTFRSGDNLLYGGDFEDVGELTQIGWQHVRAQVPGVDSQVELSTDEPRHGRYCLTLRAASTAAAQDGNPQTPVWIESPAIPVTEGQVLEIVGWVRVDPASASDPCELTIADSLGGPELALAIPATNGWERFQIIRAAADASELRLVFALEGPGMAKLDAIMVRPLQQTPPRRLPALIPANSPAPISRLPQATNKN